MTESLASTEHAAGLQLPADAPMQASASRPSYTPERLAPRSGAGRSAF